MDSKSPPFSPIIDEAMEKKMDRSESPAGHGGKAPETVQRAAPQSETRAHTPGPWRIVKSAQNILVNGDGGFVCTLDQPAGPERDANARLIAAAPAMSDEIARLRASNEELLAALTAIVNSTDYGANDDGTDDDRPLMRAARAAIANAERRT